MARRRAGAWLAVGITFIVTVVSGSVFAFQYTTAYAQCSALPGPNPCSTVAPSQIALDTAFISLFGMLAAIVMAVSTGVNFQGLTIPDFSLMRKMEQEERDYARKQAEMERQTRIAALQAARDQARQFAAAQAAAVAEAEAAARAAAAPAAGPAETIAAQVTELPGAAMVPGGVAPEPEVLLEWQLEEDRPVADPAEEARRRALESRLRNLAKRKPEAVAEVLQEWINSTQPTPAG